ncbi:MAG: alcohol dehydrogenase catalytic domain-containing protein [Alphaproteobacteria bacterium]|nr:alcohol dehydrogenase catalytic domain-containing protein [Alphaproteobacteria bacterium]
MATYTSYDVVEFGKPLQEQQRPMPVPSGTEVLLRVRRAGVCHSDVHISDGYFDLGEEGVLRMEDRGIALPKALGHEIAGQVIALGPDADGVSVGQTMLVFPWIGCRKCQACQEDRENDCTGSRFVGLVQDGGYATHCLIEHPKFLIDVEGMDLDMVTPHACSGLTVFSGLKKMGPVRGDEWIAIMGTGGLGLNAIAIAKAMGYGQIVALDNVAAKLETAKNMGADKVLDSSEDGAVEKLQAMTGNKLTGVVDTVGVPSTSYIAVRALTKTGRYVVLGLHGGDLKMPLPWLPQKALTIAGCHVGCSGDLKELLGLVRAGKVKELPVESRPLSAVDRSLNDLRKGNVTGRIVLNAD